MVSFPIPSVNKFFLPCWPSFLTPLKALLNIKPLLPYLQDLFSTFLISFLLEILYIRI